MSAPVLLAAYCAGRPVLVAGRRAPPDHRQVRCPSCGASGGLDCIEIGTRTVLYAGHQARVTAARLRDAAMHS